MRPRNPIDFSGHTSQDSEADNCDICELCGDDHETRDCGETLCGRCYEMTENCDCEDCDEIDASEWIARGRPSPKE